MSDDSKAWFSDHLADQLESAANKVADGIERVVGSARQSGSAALGQAEAGGQSVREGGPPTFDMLAARAQRMAAQAQQQAGEKLREYADKTSVYVAEKPFRSLAIAAGVGMAVAWLLGCRRD
jgi:ElaB/YqjD/DUF883 family membrane-anchored ribosome-binding protein